MPDPDRRTQIAGAAIELLAASGVRSLTHRAVDRFLALPAGSTSYYVRTRRALLEAAAAELAVRARQDFVTSTLAPPESGRAAPEVEEIARGIAAYVDRLLVARRAETLARYALSIELQQDPELRSLAVTGPFSVEGAASLMSALGAQGAVAAGHGLVSLLEGLLFVRAAGPAAGEPPAGTAESRAALQLPITRYLTGAAGPWTPGERPSDTEAPLSNEIE